MNTSKIYLSSIKLCKSFFTKTLRKTKQKAKILDYINTKTIFPSSLCLFGSIFALNTINVVKADDGNEENRNSENITVNYDDNNPSELYEEILDNIIPSDKSEDDSKGINKSTNIVKKVIGNTAKEILLDSNKNIILKVYSPTCSVCANFDYIWNTIAEEVKQNIDGIDFAEMNGQDNYVRGLIDYNNQGKYPHIICFPKGEDKIKNFEIAKDKVTKLAQYYNHQLPDEIKERFDNSIINNDTKSDIKPEFTFKDVEIVGIPYSMRWERGQSLISSLIDFIFDNSIIANYDREIIKKKVFDRLPEIQENILKSSNYSFMALYDKAITNDPCGQFIKKAMEYFFLSTGGLPTASLGSLTMSKYRSCLYSKESEVNDFYDNIKTHMKFVDSCINQKDLWNEQDEEFLKSLAEKKPELYSQLVDKSKTVY